VNIMAEEKTKSNNNSLTTTIIVAVIVAAIAFFGGMKYQQSKVRLFAAGFAGGQFGRRGGAGANGVRPVGGSIVSSDDKSVTVKLMDGSTKIILLSDKTVINKATTGSKDDLKTGQQIVVFGTTNSDGSVTAQTVAIGGGMFRGGPIPSVAPTGQ
jgi:hypothetical protein